MSNTWMGLLAGATTFTDLRPRPGGLGRFTVLTLEILRYLGTKQPLRVLSVDFRVFPVKFLPISENAALNK